MSYRGGDRRTRGRNARARWKNVLTAYARLEIGERLCKTWLAHFKCRNAMQHRRSRCIAVWGWIAVETPALAFSRMQDVYICRKLVPSDLDYGTSCFAGVENLRDWNPISGRFLTRYRYDMDMRYHVIFVIRTPSITFDIYILCERILNISITGRQLPLFILCIIPRYFQQQVKLVEHRNDQI